MRHVEMFAAALVVLCVVSVGFAAETYDLATKTLTVTADALAATIDPLGQVQDFDAAKYSVPAMSKDAFNALPGLKTVTFNSASGSGSSVATIKAYYSANDFVTFDQFGSSAGYSYGNGTGDGKRAHSGTQDYHAFGTAGGDANGGPFHGDAVASPGLNWFKAGISVSEQGRGVSAIGFIIDGRDSGSSYTDVGSIWVTLSDTTVVQLPYTKFGGVVGGGLFFGYQAPEGKFITGIECSRNNAGGNSYEAVDDLTFVIGGSAVQPLIGDINKDGYVNVGDLQALVAAWGSQQTPPSANWNADADINADGYVNVGDLQLLVAHWGESQP